LPFSSIVASLVTEKGHTARPGSEPDPFITILTLLPLTVPFADAEITSVPHVAVNVPAMLVAVCVAIWYWNAPHEFGLGSALDTQPPISGVEGPPAVGVPLGDAVVVDGAPGFSTCVDRSNAQPVAATQAARQSARGRTDRFMMTNLSLE
jgi:hypothetical protein